MKFVYINIYCTTMHGNLLESFPIVFQDKNAWKRAQEHCITRSGDGETSHFVMKPLRFTIYSILEKVTYTADLKIIYYNDA